MGANEYFKEYGLVGSREHLDWMVRVGARSDIHGDFMEDLKRLVESHGLIEKVFESVEIAEYEYMVSGCYSEPYWIRIKQAIADVGSCL